MNKEIFLSEDSLSLSAAEKEDLLDIKSLCDDTVGKDLYSLFDLEDAIDDEDKFLYILKDNGHSLIGYVYFKIEEKGKMHEEIKLSTKEEEILKAKSKKVGKLQSISLKTEFRGKGLSEKLIEFFLSILKSLNIDLAYAVCWKKGDYVPLQKAMDSTGFVYLKEEKEFWYNNSELYCPFCQGRCHCDAEIYYKKLEMKL